jgi:hypothetical protein
MNAQLTNQEKPTLVHVIAWMTLASGIVNLFWGIGASGTALATVLGIICIPITILPTVLGIFEIIYAAKLMSNPPQQIQPSTNIAILEIVCILLANIFAVVVGILALIFYNDLAVKEYFSRLNGTLSPAAVASTTSASMLEIESATANSSEVKPEERTPDTEPTSSDEETPKG